MTLDPTGFVDLVVIYPSNDHGDARRFLVHKDDKDEFIGNIMGAWVNSDIKPFIILTRSLKRIIALKVVEQLPDCEGYEEEISEAAYNSWQNMDSGDLEEIQARIYIENLLDEL